MTALHAHFTLRQQQAFQRLLDTPTRSQSSSQGLSTSGGKSFNRKARLAPPPCDVNARDAQGRTVLHLAASATDAAATEYVRMLLAHPYILVNIPDRESHWTALHRALYHGNLATALILLQRSDLDVSLKDSEGYTAFDLYNSTVEGTKPPTVEDAQLRADLYTWGVNRNAALGHGDADDRTAPDQVSLEPASSRPDDAPVVERFAPVVVKQIVMSKLHTGVVTTETKANFRVCGFGSGGRLGPGQHTQYTLSPMTQITQPMASVALGQDHTLALTTTGEVLSWGLNRFSQLGYVLDAPTGVTARIEEPIQPVPRKIGSLKGKVVLGVAACKTASACWTVSEVYTWGTNNGQLGYDRNAHPVQVLPRVVTRVSQPVLSVSIADSAMACLLETHDVLCLYNDSHFRVTFPAQAFPSDITAYRPPQAIRNASIEKITSCENTFAALSSNGELFTFALALPSDAGASGSGKSRDIVKPQRVWALRKKFSAVKDVALGADGLIIICTESGHVFVRTRTGGKTLKFQRIPHLQRIVKVCANSTGAFGALRFDAYQDPIAIEGNLLPQDLARVQPYLSIISADDKTLPLPTLTIQGDADELEDSPSIAKDQRELTSLCRLLIAHSEAHKAGTNDGPFAEVEDNTDRHGADLLIHVHAKFQPRIPAHRVVLAARSHVLADVLKGGRAVDYKSGTVYIKLNLAKQTPVSRSTSSPPAPWARPAKLSLSGCHPLSLLILLVYLYSDELLALWDWRVAEPLKPLLTSLRVQVSDVKAELQACARAFELPLLEIALGAAFKRDVQLSLIQRFQPLSAASPSAVPVKTTQENDPLAADVLLLLADTEVPCHSVVLRARSPFFQSFFDAGDWTSKRWTPDGVIRVDFQHMNWGIVRFVVMFMYGGDAEIFSTLETVKSAEELIELMIDVIAVANELLIDRLSLICSAVILQHVNLSSAPSLLVDSAHFNAQPLVRSIQGYIAQSLETFLESHMLSDLPADTVKQLSTFLRRRQAEKSPLARSNLLTQLATERNQEWLAMQDFPEPVVPSARITSPRERNPNLSPPGPLRLQKSASSPPTSPLMRPEILSSRPTVEADICEDEVFLMDGMDSVPPLSLNSPSVAQLEKDKERRDVLDSAPAKNTPGWKVSATPRVDMKSILAEAEVRRLPSGKTAAAASPARAEGSGAVDSNNWRSTQPSAPQQLSRVPSGSPWKTPPPPTNATGFTPQPSPAQTPPMTPLLRPMQSKEERSKTQAPQAPGASKPGLGPMISPRRQTSWKNTDLLGARRVSGQTAWTLPPVQPSVQPSTSTSGMSFVAIQQLQLQQNTPVKQDKRTLKEIQEEEAARQVEEDFMKWWTAEEERLKAEQPEASVPPKSPKRPTQRKKEVSSKGKARPPQKEAQGNGNDGAGSSKKSDQSQGNAKVIDKKKTDHKDGRQSPRAKRRPPAVVQQPAERSGHGDDKKPV